MREIRRHFDVREYKKNLRERFKKLRLEIPAEKRLEKNDKIRTRVMNLPEYKDCGTLLCYVSTHAEVDTRNLIECAINHGKTVAVPYCIEGTRDMEFYKITSLAQLVPRTFGVLEPIADEKNRITDFSGSICVLPGIAFDMAGYRLGYGGGYYDRFLSRKYKGVTVGICYSECTLNSIRHGRFDMVCNMLVTDLFLKRNG